SADAERVGLTRSATRVAAIELVDGDADRVVGVNEDRSDADRRRSERREARARRVVETEVIADEERGVTRVDRRVAYVGCTLLEHVRRGYADVRDDDVEPSLRDREAVANHVEAGCIVGARERVLHERREAALVGSEEANRGAVDAKRTRRAR